MHESTTADALAVIADWMQATHETLCEIRESNEYMAQRIALLDEEVADLNSRLYTISN